MKIYKISCVIFLMIFFSCTNSQNLKHNDLAENKINGNVKKLTTYLYKIQNIDDKIIDSLFYGKNVVHYNADGNFSQIRITTNMENNRRYLSSVDYNGKNYKISSGYEDEKLHEELYNYIKTDKGNYSYKSTLSDGTSCVILLSPDKKLLSFYAVIK